jgi:hypothetical protein
MLVSLGGCGIAGVGRCGLVRPEFHCGTVGVGTRFKVVGRQVRGASFCRWARFMACSCFVTLRAALAGGALYAPPACQSATTPLLESPGLEVAGQLVLRVLRIRRFGSDLLTTCDSTVTGLSWGVCAVSDANDHCFNCRSPGSHLASDAYMPIEVDLTGGLSLGNTPVLCCAAWRLEC